jgi:oxygen-independent coproporphyrinogen-3 oxidase
MIPTNQISSFLEKYNISGPRYTSYPTAPHFHSNISYLDWINALNQSNESKNEISLYFHIPFCHSLCYFCGCNMQVTRNKEKVKNYLSHLFDEITLISSKLPNDRKISQIHFGGGTPNFLTSRQLDTLGEKINTSFSISSDVEFSCEIDPRSTSQAHIKSLKNMGVNRISMGIQDFDKKVQEKINRKHTLKDITALINLLKLEKINAFNIDLIYGLPGQTESSFKATLEKIIELNPSRIACYNFAYLPWLKPHHKLIQENELPCASTKIKLFSMTIDSLQQNGYTYIGMDHFAKNNDELVLAQKNGTLQRNFQGYSTHRNTDLFAFGPSSISNFGNAFFQNHKNLSIYNSLLDENKTPIDKGIMLSEEDLLIHDVITTLMCNLKLEFKHFNEKYNLDFKQFFSTELIQLDELFSDDKFVLISESSISITELGRLFIRNIAMVFDRYLKKDNSFYSKTI